MREGSKGSIISRNYHTVYLEGKFKLWAKVGEEEEKDDRCNNISWGEGFFLELWLFCFFVERDSLFWFDFF